MMTASSQGQTLMFNGCVSALGVIGFGCTAEYQKCGFTEGMIILIGSGWTLMRRITRGKQGKYQRHHPKRLRQARVN